MAKKLTRRAYEDKLLKHMDSIRELTKRFNPDVVHISLSIVGNSEWAIAYTGEGIDTKVADVYWHFEKDDCHKFLKRAKLPCEGEDGKDEVVYFDDQQ